jgi:hypothetical protein
VSPTLGETSDRDRGLEEASATGEAILLVGFTDGSAARAEVSQARTRIIARELLIV